jgi:uncharacterized protein (DUF885 family)
MIGTITGDERHDDLLPDPSDEGRARSGMVARAGLAELDRVNRPALDVVLRTTMDLVESIANRTLLELEYRTDRLQVASHLWGPGQLVAELGSLQRADTPERLDRYVARLCAIPNFLNAVVEIVEEGPRCGVVSPQIVAKRAIAQVERYLATPPESSPALRPVGPDAAARDSVAATLRDVVNPAYEAYLEALRSYLPYATNSIGLWALPKGEELYAAQILRWTTLPASPTEVHELGGELLAAIQEERREVAAGLGFQQPAEAIAAHGAAGKNTAESPEALLNMARDQVQRSWSAASDFFGRMPRANCDVRLVEEFREADMPAAYYRSSTEDGTRPGTFYVNAYDLPSRPLHRLATTTYHEANPGHHFQFSIEQELEARPRLRQFAGLLADSAFVEGWGLYAERLSDEMGLFIDEWERLGMLDAQAHRAARLVTDSGIHALGWTRERSIDTLVRTGLPRIDATIEVDRYIAMPGQALAYMIGMIEIRRAREAEAARLGSAFSLSAFHDRLLSLGSLPMPALRRELGTD